MQLYDKPVRLLMRDMAVELVPTPGQSFTKQQAIEWFSKHYPKIQPVTVPFDPTLNKWFVALALQA